MAFRSNGPVILALPPFRGVTRRIILTALSVYLGLAALGFIAPAVAEWLTLHTLLVPSLVVRGAVWQLVTYPFLGGGLLSMAFALLSLWFFAASLEDERGSRWLSDCFWVATAGGGLLAVLIQISVGARSTWMPVGIAGGLWPFVLATVVAFAVLAPEQSVSFNFFFQVKAKYLAAIYVVFYVALSLRGGDRFGALLALTNGGCGYAFLRLAPRRGVRVGVSEWWFGLRNEYYRRKRLHAAKKFTVYMRKQGKDVSLDADGRYIDPLDPHDPTERKWMN